MGARQLERLPRPRVGDLEPKVGGLEPMVGDLAPRVGDLGPRVGDLGLAMDIMLELCCKHRIMLLSRVCSTGQQTARRKLPTEAGPGLPGAAFPP